MPASAENSSPATATSRSATLSPRAQPPNLLLRTQMKMATPTSSSTPNADIIAVCPVMICQPPVSKQSHYSGANQRARSWSRSGSCHNGENTWITLMPVSYTHLRAHETRHDLVCRLLLEKKKKKKPNERLV